MTKDEMKIAIAVDQGWEWHGPEDEEAKYLRYWRRVESTSVLDDIYAYQLPNYPEDLNAMHEVEKTLKSDIHAYYSHLGLIVGSHGDKRISAEAHQRAEAYLRMKGLYKD